MSQSECGKNWLEKTKKWNPSGRNRFEVAKNSGSLLLIPAIGFLDGFGGALAFILKCAASEVARNGLEKTKGWAEGRIRAKGKSDEQKNLLIKGGGAVLAAAYVACRFILFRGGSSVGNVGKLMKAPGRPGEFIARAAFEANPKAYFDGLRGKLP